MKTNFGEWATKYAKAITWVIVGVTVLIAVAAILPSVWPRQFPWLNSLQVDTDPENMLAQDEPVRVFHNRMKEKLNLHDMVVVGVVNRQNTNGVFNPDSLNRIHILSEYVQTLRWLNEEGRQVGIIEQDMISPSVVDSIEPGSLGEIRFEWLMPEPPTNQQAADEIFRKAHRVPFLRGTMVPQHQDDQQAVCLYLPISSKDLSYHFYDALNRQIPILWQWSPVKQRLESTDFPSDTSDGSPKTTLLELGRLAAFYSQSRSAFNDRLSRLLTYQGEGTPEATVDQVIDRIKAWQAEAAALDAETKAQAKQHVMARRSAFERAIRSAGKIDVGLTNTLPNMVFEESRSPWPRSTRQTIKRLSVKVADLEAPTDGQAPSDPGSVRHHLRQALNADAELARYRSHRTKLAHRKLATHLTQAANDSPKLALWLDYADLYRQSQEGRIQTAASLLKSIVGHSRDHIKPVLANPQSVGSVAPALQESLESGGKSGDDYYITGLPVAEDTFGVEMFIQMAISAPSAMLLILLLMLAFFRKLILVLSPLIIAMATVIITMGLLVITGYPIHIMSSMIPIFLMPIAVLDSIHVISEFFDRYRATHDRRQTSIDVMHELFRPMLYTSLTSAAGFASLALTPIPPVQVFGLFVAIGILLAWLLTILFIPAFVMLLPEKSLANFGAKHSATETDEGTGSWLSRGLDRLQRITFQRYKPILALSLVILAIAAYGITQIQVNDNPIKWFVPSHPIRVADRVLNDHLGGTYMAYLTLDAKQQEFAPQAFLQQFTQRAEQQAEDLKEGLPSASGVFNTLNDLAEKAAATSSSRTQFFERLGEMVNRRIQKASGEAAFAWDEASLFVDKQAQLTQVFKDPEVLNYLAGLQEKLRNTGTVGKVNSVADIVKTVHRDLLSGESKDFRIPDNRKMVAECLIQFQNSHRPNDLWHFVTPDYRTSSLWVQLRTGDNKDMSKIVQEIEDYLDANPPPSSLSQQADWFGLTYINVVWQEKMVIGMLQAFAGSFLVVLLLMIILFRSLLTALLSMIPLTVTIVAIYGTIGIIGKDYDMPVAVLSSLTLGLAIDFAIHFLARSRKLQLEHGTWRATLPHVFGEPARAISRNVIVIAAGFLPLLLAPLVPYKTVGALMATILLVSGLTTLILLPALIRVMERYLFTPKEPVGTTCNCALCVTASVVLVALIAINLHQYAMIGWTTLTWVSLIAIPILALSCGILSRRERCRVEPPTQTQPKSSDHETD